MSSSAGGKQMQRGSVSAGVRVNPTCSSLAATVTGSAAVMVTWSMSRAETFIRAVLQPAAAGSSAPRFERLADQRHGVVHHAADRGRQFVWQEVDRPNQPALCRPVGQDLYHTIVVGRAAADRRVGEPHALVVRRHQALAGDNAVIKGEDAVALVHFVLDEETGSHPDMDPAEIAHGVPDLGGGGVELHFASIGGHRWRSSEMNAVLL